MNRATPQRHGHVLQTWVGAQCDELATFELKRQHATVDGRRSAAKQQKNRLRSEFRTRLHIRSPYFEDTTVPL